MLKPLVPSASLPLTRAISIALGLSLAVSTSACRLSSNNSEKLTALQQGETYDEDGVLSVSISTPAEGAVINVLNNSATYALAGNCSKADQSVRITVDGSEASALNGGSCNGATWAATISTLDLSAGTHTFQVSIASATGATKFSEPVIVTKDVTVPTAAITAPANNSYVNLGNNSASFAVSGTCDDSTASVQVKVDGSNSGTAATCSGTNWSASISTVALSQGAHTLIAQVTDPAGNSVSSSAVLITKDTSAPSVAVSAPASNSSINASTDSTTFAASGTCSGTSESGRTVTLKLDGATPTQSSITCGAGSTWSGTLDTTALSDGTHTLTATLADAAGNSATSSNTLLIKDESAPSVALTYPAHGSYLQAHNSTSSFALSGTCSEASQSVTVKVNGANASGQSGGTCASGAWNATIDATALSAASLTLSATHSDAAGNSATSNSNTLTRDLTKPGSLTFTRASVAYDPYTGAEAASGAPRFVKIGSNTTAYYPEPSTTNKVVNPFFETNITGYTTGMEFDLTRDSTRAWQGTSSLKATRNANAGTGRITGFLAGALDSAMSASTTYTISSKVYVETTATLTTVKWADHAGTQVTSIASREYDMTAKGTWQTVYFTFTTHATATPILVLQTLTGGATGDVLYVDGVQLEQKSYPTTPTVGTRPADSLSISNSGVVQPSAGAIITRVYVEGDSANATVRNDHVFFDSGSSGSLSRILLYQSAGTPGKWRAVLYDGTTAWANTTAEFSGTLTTGWHTIGAHWSSGRIALYIDGQEKHGLTPTALPSTLGITAKIGCTLSCNEQATMPMDYLVTYLRSPSAAEMQTFTGSAGPSGEDFRLDFDAMSFTRTSTAMDPLTLAQAASGAPRFTIQGGSTGIAIDQSTTNQYTYSEQFDNAAWTKYDATIAANATAAPDGNTAADKLVENTANGIHYVSIGNAFSASTAYTLSVYAKAAERNRIFLDFSSYTNWSGGNPYARFDLSAGTITASGSGGTAHIQSVGNGWYRCSVTATKNATPETVGANIGLLNSSGTSVFTGDGTSGVYLWGAQLEQKPYATTYHPTPSSASTTRSAEVLTVSGAGLLDTASGKIRARLMITRKSGTDLQTIVDAGTTGTNGNYFMVTTNGQIGMQVGTGASTQSAVGTTVLTPFTWYEVEGHWTANSVGVKVNGTNESTVSITPVVTLRNDFYLGSNGGTSRFLDGVLDWVEFERSDGTTQRYHFSNSLGQ